MNLKEIDLRNIYRKWKSGLGAFEGFFRSTPFVSLQTYDDFIIADADISKCNEKILKIIIENCNEDNFLIIDLPLNEILDLALVLNNEYSIKPILNINLLFHPFGIIGNKNNIIKLINNGLKLKNINTDKFVMLIPYDRYDEEIENTGLRDKLNNQYGIGEDDLPYAENLREIGYKNIIIITKDKVKEDLYNYINFIKNNENIKIFELIL